jgi:hypothetical protein
MSTNVNTKQFGNFRQTNNKKFDEEARQTWARQNVPNAHLAKG